MVSTNSTQFGTRLIRNTLTAMTPTTKKTHAKKEFRDCVAKTMGNIAIATTMNNSCLDRLNKNEE